MASLALGAVGSAIGGTFFAAGAFGMSGAAIGWSVGSFLGGQLFGAKTPDQQGSRLGDLRVQSSAYGAPIPIVYGTVRVAGNIIWALPIRETSHKEDVGGKGGGGGSVTTFTYSATLALAIAEGEITGIRRIWADANLMYDVGNNASIETIIASNKAAGGIKIYTGSETQIAETLIQSDKGAANVQAFRGTAYVLFNDLQLEKYGNRIPNITVEALKVGANVPRVIEDIDTPIAIPSRSWLANASYYGDSGEHFIVQSTATSGSAYKLYNVWLDGTQELLQEHTPNSGYGSTIGDLISDEPAYIANGVFGATAGKFYLYTFDNITGLATTGGYWFDLGFGYSPTHNTMRHQKLGDFLYTFNYGSPTEVRRGGLTVYGADGSLTMIVLIAEADLNTGAWSMYITDDYIYMLNNDDTIDLFDLDGNFDSTISFTPSVTILYASSRQDIIKVDNGVIYILSVSGHVHKIEDSIYTYLGQVLFNAEATGAGSTHMADGVATSYRYGSDDIRFMTVDSVSESSTTLDVIQGDICDRAGLEAGEYDVTELTDSVEGYVITRPMSARSASEPLQQAFFYDAAEIANKLDFIKRGGVSAVSIPEDDLGASSGTNAPLMRQTRQQDAELPSQVIIKYIDVDLDFQQGSQRAQIINANVENVVMVDLAIVMTGSDAKKIAEILLFNSWVEREKFNLALTHEYIGRNPTDVITVTADGQTRLMRITSINFGAVLSLECVSEDLQVYSSAAEAGTPESTDQTVGLDGASKLFLLDIPLLRNADDNASGMYVAVTGVMSGWTGASIFKSLDSGVSYSPIIDVFNKATTGKATTALADHGVTLWDKTNTVTVNLTSGTLSSTTELAVLKGANYALLGDEIIQFVNATLNVNGTYTLDTLLRGRRGTDWATVDHVINDDFVLLTEDQIRRMEAVINTERDYKAVTYGNFLDDASNMPKTNNGVSEKPFSPVLVKGSRDGSLNLTITWNRRSRQIGSALWVLPVMEETESYEVDIMNGATVVRTISITSETASYTAAQQVTDFGSTQASITVRVYQLSASLGRGYVKEEIL